ncbi:Ingression protein fic1 [Pseudocercospora fuligena]|uniref:Ingression protein fic1 n=1 Tax=Pseudocercospora fuligena TaxID=685502 RepID=A0A8H6RHC7_9PEZI|nr:Ingression protein fic1 [Pseudocercospora fuligena]
MGSKMASNGPHAAGIFADMTVDGPEIGTLVLVVDRAKNLPNRKTMGKQNPYCAARLGKEARKTETDRRGGQTPRWDQELRFTVHDSPDYYTLKISVFSEDKRTDLIGEAWVDLGTIVVPGGGKGDSWQGLTCKGKYAGEVRMEVTYYDTREKPMDKGEEQMSMADELKQQYGTLQPKVKRRPLPVNPNAPATKDVVIPERPNPGRAKHGPRDYQTLPRATSTGPKTYNYPASESTLFGQTPVGSQASSPAPSAQYGAPQDQYYGEYDQHPEAQEYDPHAPVQTPDFLPQLGPSRAQRASSTQPPRPQQMFTPPRHQTQPQPQPRPMSHIGIPHSHSAPVIPQAHESEPYENDYQLSTNFPEPIPDLDYQYQHTRQRRNDVPPGWEDEYGGAYSDKQAYVEDELDSSPPPPPPMHSHSSPAVPQSHQASPHHLQMYQQPRYAATPASARQQYVPNSSPLQSIERGYAPQQTPPSQGHPRRGQSMDEYSQSPYQASHHSTPNLSSPGSQGPSPYARTSPYGRPVAGRNSVAEYTPSRQPHPLSQEIPRARSPNPYRPEPTPYQTPDRQPPYQADYRNRDAVPLIKPRAVSPQPQPQSAPASAPPRNSYSIQFPVRAFESSSDSPLSTSQPAPQPERVRATVVSRNPPLRKSVSPRPSMSEGSGTPFSPDSFDVHNPKGPGAEANVAPKGPIVGWHGQEIDPSDHLPVDSWAPEPEKKTPTKTYGTGRDRDFGPRHLSKDTVVNFRNKSSPMPTPEPQPTRNKLFKKSPSRSPGPAMEPLRTHENFNPVPNPYEQRQQYSRGFGETSPGGYGPPNVPPKVPLSHSPGGYNEDALSREISSIDIGSSRQRSSPAAYVPVRSHRDRNSFY